MNTRETAGKTADTTGGGINHLGRQHLIQPLNQHTAMGLDELAVHTGDIDLAQIDRGSWIRGHPIETSSRRSQIV